MKKIISIILALISVICVAFALGGCGDTNEVRGEFYTLKEAYENGWLNEDDLKSIACGYYDKYKYEENPYGGYERPAEELSKEMENEIKQAYLNQIAKYPDVLLDKVEISRYYGKYNGNFVVSMYSQYFMCDIIVEPEFDIGGVIFKNFWQGEIRVYHIN